MTSHLTVSVTSAEAGVAPVGPTAAPGAGKAQPLGAFGAILDALRAPDLGATGGLAGALAALTEGRGTAAGKAAAGFVQLETTTAGGGATGLPAQLPDALPGLVNVNVDAEGRIAVPLAATLTTGTPATDAAGAAADAGTPPRLLRNLVAALADLDKAEQAGKSLDKDLLKRVKDAIDALASFLAAQQPAALPQPAAPPPATLPAGPDGVAAAAGAGMTAPATGPAPDRETLERAKAHPEAAAAATVAARATLARLGERITALSSTLAHDQPALAARLDDLVRRLAPQALDGATLAQLGLGAGAAAPDPDLAAAINGLVAGKSGSANSAAPTLAAPALKLPAGSSLVATPERSGTAAAAATPPARLADPGARAAATGTPADTAASPADAAAGKAAVTAGPGPAGHPVADRTVEARAADAPAAAGASAATGAGAVPPPVAAHAGLRQVQDAYQAAAPQPINLPQLAFEIVRHAQPGASHFQIRLDPADMGRVDVRLAIDGSGSVNAHLTVERPETLDLLRRDAGALGQALSQAGLDAGKTSLQFSLGQNPFTRQDGRPDPGPAFAPPAAPEAATADPVVPAGGPLLYRGTLAASGLNIFV